MATIYSAKYLLPIDAPPIAGGALLDLDGEIAAVGSLKQLRHEFPAADVVEYAEAVITPLLINAHTHLELTDFPVWAGKAGETEKLNDFVDWILKLIRVKRSLGKKDYHQSIENGIRLSLAAGTGAVGDILSQYACRKAYKKSTLQGIVYLESLGHDPGIISKVRQELRSVLAEEQVGNLRFGLSPHSPYTISSEYLQDIFSKCRRQGLPCSTHLAESPAEVEFIQQGRGDLAEKLYPFVGWEYLVPDGSSLRPAAYLQSQGGLFPGNLLVHGVQLVDKEIDLLKSKKMALALCPRSNAKLSVGKAPVQQLMRAGIKLCLGTDSLASNDSLSIWDEAAFAHSWFAGAIDAPSLLRMATRHGAEVLGVDKRLGSLEKGKDSSFQVIHIDSSVAENELYDYLVAPGVTENILQVVHQGQTMLV
ncbi:Cytosine/adenosine deaminase [Malonomonas rubra DSM 5091]|uniref:Cytosine/adenosine deaminase n=1 Tax=Malonomonas rubra DSM 5091 TaxID=1122189 RepID=A0A1M6B209_MALRU|nr:amidohydrolase family protein [Malonomonas rubra]SHI42746.1 Cytosine/adenosine deaminase [Malonomonas rubra DSM 5091]